ncbi:MAG TPA: hypothetical protein DDZ51_13910 [Planctomycetaceae bacterium]|nr:hypothetical protein [Planctomycetaceae bacterium]
MFLRPRKLAVPVENRFLRRDFLLTSAAGGIACLAGCKPSSQTEIAPAVRTDVPLRVLICGDASWGEAIQTAWGGIAQQPLAIESLALGVLSEGGSQDGDVAEKATLKPSSDFARRVVAALSRNDVAILPCGVMADVYESESLMPLGEDVLDDEGLAAKRFFPVIGESLMRWSGIPVAVPLGCLQPSMLVSADAAAKLGQNDESVLPKTWGEFEQALKQAAGDTVLAAEPLAAGAAAKMFLWRASDAAPAVWLFDRVSFRPVLTEETYVMTLETMRQNAMLYGNARWTPGEVWNGVSSGRFSIALGWPDAFGDPPRVESIGDTIATALPMNQKTSDAVAITGPVLPDPDAPLAVISSRCRQTVAAKRFLIWISGGEGSEMIRATIGPMTAIRREPDVSGEPSGSMAGDYATFLTQRLSSLNLRPTIRLHGYDRYMAALDQGVIACLDGKQTAVEALAGVSEAWQAITSEIGPDRQAKAWRLAQGLRN